MNGLFFYTILYPEIIQSSVVFLKMKKRMEE